MFFMMEIFDSLLNLKLISNIACFSYSFFTLDTYNEEKFNKKIIIIFIYHFFPQLIAGPIVHHKEIIEQYRI